MEFKSPLGLLGRLPLEIRYKIYSDVFQGQVIHCCSGKDHAVRHGIARAASPLSPCSLKAFEKECAECCERDYEPPLGAARVPRWSNVSSYADSSFLPADSLALFLTCRSLWGETEPLSWDLITLNIGFPQFGAFYDRFLREDRNSHLVTKPRGQLLKNLQLVVPDNSKLGSLMGLDSRFTHLSTHYVVKAGFDYSMIHLPSCIGLNNVSMTIAASLVLQTQNPEMQLLLHYSIINLILRLPSPLSRFQVVYIGQLRHEERPHGDNYDDLSENDPVKQKLDVLTSMLVQKVLGQIKLEPIWEPEFFDDEDPVIIALTDHVKRRLDESWESVQEADERNTTS